MTHKVTLTRLELAEAIAEWLERTHTIEVKGDRRAAFDVEKNAFDHIIAIKGACLTWDE